MTTLSARKYSLFAVVLVALLSVVFSDEIRDDVFKILKTRQLMMMKKDKTPTTVVSSGKGGKGGSGKGGKGSKSGKGSNDFMLNCTVTNTTGLTTVDNTTTTACAVLKGSKSLKKSKKISSKEEGIFVCRTVMNPSEDTLTNFTTCINPDKAKETDTCGCCEGMCPMSCPCVCTPSGKNAVEDSGVLVVIETKSGKKNFTRCLEESIALTLLAHPDERTTCDTMCMVEK